MRAYRWRKVVLLNWFEFSLRCPLCYFVAVEGNSISELFSLQESLRIWRIKAMTKTTVNNSHFQKLNKYEQVIDQLLTEENKSAKEL